MSVYIYIHRIQYKHDICIKYISQKKHKNRTYFSHYPPNSPTFKVSHLFNSPNLEELPPASPKSNLVFSSPLRNLTLRRAPWPNSNTASAWRGFWRRLDGWEHMLVHPVICCTLGVPLQGVFSGVVLGWNFLQQKKLTTQPQESFWEENIEKSSRFI